VSILQAARSSAFFHAMSSFLFECERAEQRHKMNRFEKRIMISPLVRLSAYKLYILHRIKIWEDIAKRSYLFSYSQLASLAARLLLYAVTSTSPTTCHRCNSNLAWAMFLGTHMPSRRPISSVIVEKKLRKPKEREYQNCWIIFPYFAFILYVMRCYRKNEV